MWYDQYIYTQQQKISDRLFWFIMSRECANTKTPFRRKNFMYSTRLIYPTRRINYANN